MLFHLMNFKHGSLFASSEELPYALVKPGEYHRFDTAEVDAHSLADKSSNLTEESKETDGEQASFNQDCDKDLVPNNLTLSSSLLDIVGDCKPLNKTNDLADYSYEM